MKYLIVVLMLLIQGCYYNPYYDPYYYQGYRSNYQTQSNHQVIFVPGRPIPYVCSSLGAHTVCH